jgi:iron complex outermembrane recepter protein
MGVNVVKKFYVNVGLVFLSSVQGGFAEAQESAPANQSSGQLETIIVTAEKRSEDLQNAPVAVQSIAGDSLAQNGVLDLRDLSREVPAVQVETLAGSTVLSIRGIRTSDATAGGESPNAVYVDGANYSRLTGLGGMLFDIDRVEVLKGPQGTLFGRNATGGAFNITTRKPTDDYSSDLQLEGGNYSMQRIEGAVNLPLNDSLSTRTAFRAVSRSGYFQNGLDDDKQQSARESIFWKPDSRTNFLLVADYSHIGGKGTGDNVVADSTGENVPPTRNNSSIYPSVDRAELDTKIWGLVGQLTYELDPVSLTVIGSHRELDAKGQEYSTGNLEFLPAKDHSSSAEARVTSIATTPVSYVFGVYYFQEAGSGALYSFASQTSRDFSSQFVSNGFKTKSYAAFGQATWTPFDPLHLTAGVRYSEDDKSGAGYTLVFGPSEPYDGTASWNAVTYKVGASFDLGPRSMLYADVSTGFKSGGFAFGENPKYDPEYITAFEVGSKNRFFNNSLEINANAYLYNYRNFELTYLTVNFDPTTNQVLIGLNATNAGRARIYGVDLDTKWAATDSDRLDFTLSYLHARYGENDLTRFGQENLTGQPLPDAPDWSFDAAYNHTWTFGFGSFDARMDTLYGGSRLINLAREDAPDARFQRSYFRSNVSLTYQPPNSKWKLTGYVNNLGTHNVWQQAIVSGPQTFANFLPPVTFGAILGLQFR